MTAGLEQWERRLQEMKACPDVATLVSRFGEPHHKVLASDIEIWHYPMGSSAGLNYSIHVAVSAGKAGQTYLYFEPASGAQSISPRPWWKFWG